MAEIHECEHITAVTLGPDDRIALVVPEGYTVNDLKTWRDMLEEWWPGRVIVVQEPLRVVAAGGRRG